ncbi:hypothetical protein KCP69_13775 [Salmonella enterica subsp. enterica]|nr:hypothetical protein KCP69_13775 [Salmonella enterica subsp. enterica]
MLTLVSTLRRLQGNLLTFAIDRANAQNVPASGVLYHCVWTKDETLAGEPFKIFGSFCAPYTLNGSGVMTSKGCKRRSIVMRSPLQVYGQRRFRFFSMG